MRLIEDAQGEVSVELSINKMRFTFGDALLTTKLIDGTFPDYGRVIPAGNDKRLTVERDVFAKAVDRVSTISSERGRAVKLSLSESKLVLSVTNPDQGSAVEELEADYDGPPLDIGFNARYLLGHHPAARQRHGAVQARRPRLADAGAGPRRGHRALCPDADARLSLGTTPLSLGETPPAR